MNRVLNYMKAREQRYNHQIYWEMRNKLTSKNGGRLYRIYLLYRIKRSDAFNCASLGTHLEKSAVFKSPHNFPHGLNGIVVSHNAVIGENATIFRQVTIAEGNGGTDYR